MIRCSAGGGDDALDAVALEWTQVDPTGTQSPADLGQRAPEGMLTVQLVTAVRQDEKESPSGSAGERRREVLGRPIGPMHVLQDQQQRTRTARLQHRLAQVVQQTKAAGLRFRRQVKGWEYPAR